MNAIAQQTSIESKLYRQYSQARFAFENIDKHPDTPWLVDEYIERALSLSQVLDEDCREFLLLKVYRSVLSMVRSSNNQHCLRQHALNQVYQLLNALHMCLAQNEGREHQMNFLYQELKSIRI